MDPHISNLKSKCLRLVNTFKYLLNSNYGCSRKRLLHRYKALILTRLGYGSQLYPTANKTVLRSLDTMQSAALRLATGAFQTRPTFSLCAETTALHYRRIKLTVNLLLSIAQNPSLPSFNLLFKSNFTLHNTHSDAIPLLPRNYHTLLPPNHLLRTTDMNSPTSSP